MRWEEKFFRTMTSETKNTIEFKEIEIGRVISVEPLQIMAKDLPLFRQNIYMNADLLENTKEIIDTEKNSISFKTPLKAGDMVALVAAANNKYIVLCKLV